MFNQIPQAFASTRNAFFSPISPPIAAVIEKFFVQDVEDFRELLRQPSISATGEGMFDAAQGLLSYFRNLGFVPKLVGEEFGGYPSVFVEIPGERPETLLIYGHYDVQPPDPLEEWEFPPFAATLVGDRIYARGSVDDKGNFFCAIKAIEAYLRAGIPLPIS